MLVVGRTLHYSDDQRGPNIKQEFNRFRKKNTFIECQLSGFQNQIDSLLKMIVLGHRKRFKHV
ncbi:hypothetical protein BKH38_08480 [Actinomyces naeslundii]|nr:hypothetical protein BKH38_08480 [Actinomyces naeslundii]